MSAFGKAIPVNVVTGFLGSGKTTIIKRLLASPDLADTAVLVNEFGEVGLDHHLFRSVNENTILLGNGCVCCAILGDMKDALRDLFSQMTRGDVPPFKRVIVETSGLADPVPIAYTVQSEPVLRHHFRLGNVITTIDAVNGAGQLETHEESVKQAAVADFIIITKTDLAESAGIGSLKSRLAKLNAGAPVLDGSRDAVSPQHLFRDDLSDLDSRASIVQSWFSNPEEENHGLSHSHSDGIQSFCVQTDQPLDWTAFGIWMSMLLHCHGDKVLRIKGLLNVSDVETPVLINGVQHIVHPPVHLAEWPDNDRNSRLIFIVQGMSIDNIRRSLDSFNRLANPGITEIQKSA
ncbi:MAG: GTP-binding protein [Rhizobiaceae bacterium]